MASPAPLIANEHLLPVLGDDLMELIFLRLPTPSDLARASIACPSFRRIITERSFLRRFRKLHPPPLLGLIADKAVFHPVQAPDPSAPLARALVDGADFSYSFVPKPSNGCLPRWCPRDARDGRVLLECTSFVRGNGSKPAFTNLAVCDPLSRRYVLLPPIPEDMTAQQERLVEFQPMLAPLVDEDEDETLFTLMCIARYKSKLVMFVFASVSGQWCIAASPSWSSLGSDKPHGRHGLCSSHYVSGYFYWTTLWKDKLLVLDIRRMEFTVNILTGCHMRLMNRPDQSTCLPAMAMGKKGALEMLYLNRCDPLNSTVVYGTQQDNSDSSKEWQMKDIIPLPRYYLYSIVGATEGLLFLQGCPEHDQSVVEYFSLVVKTSELQKVWSGAYYNSPDRVHPYFGFPPSLLKPSL